MYLSRDLLVYEGSNYILTYNYAVHSVCIIKRELYDTLYKSNEILEESIPLADMEKLIDKGIIYRNQAEYEIKKGAFQEKYIKKFKNKNVKEVYWHITQRCNLACEYCYNKANLNKKEEPLISEIEEIADKLEGLGVKSIVLTGGEVLIRKDIVDICQRLARRFNLTLLTNGTLLHKYYNILEYVNNLIVSLDTMDIEKNLRKGLDIAQLTNTLKGIKYEYRDKI